MPRRQAKFVKLHPADNFLDALPPAIFEHPDEFKPNQAHDGRCISWGLADEEWETRMQDNSMGPLPYNLMRIMQTQQLYNGFMGSHIKETPELQFVNALIAKKEKAIAAQHDEISATFAKRDYVIEIDMVERWDVSDDAGPDELQKLERSEPRVWRRIVVGGAVTLRALQDKIIAPAFGYVRNYHGYYFTDFSDGSLFGPSKSEAIDMMHLPMHGLHAFADDRKARLADIIQNIGDTMGYVYDIGDNFCHVLKVVEIRCEEESNGKVEVLDGAMACPPEDSCGYKEHGMGSRAYGNFLRELAAAGRGTAAWKKLCKKVDNDSPLNYKGKSFDPEKFSVTEAQSRVKEALRSPASVPEGAKKFEVGLGPGSLGGGFSGSAPGKGKGTKVQATPVEVDDDSSSAAGFLSGLAGGFFGGAAAPRTRMVETVADGSTKSKREDSVCYECGSGENLKLCSGCQVARFCSKECQIAAWKWHKQECKEKAAAKKKAAQGSGSGKGK